MRYLPVAELQIGDVVDISMTETGQRGYQAYSTATVKNVTPEYVEFFRPYVSTANFIYTGGVICTVGVEEWKVQFPSSIHYMLIERRDPEMARKAAAMVKVELAAALEAGDLSAAKRLLSSL